MTEKYHKSFNKQYREVKIGSPIGISGGFIFLLIAIIHITTDIIDIASIFYLIIGSFLLFYCSALFFLYWKCAQYQKKQQAIPKWFRIITGLFLMLYLTFYQLDKKKYRYYLVLKEWRFYVLLWIFICVLTVLLSLYRIIHTGQTFWMLVTLLIETVVFIINLVLMIFIWKYQGTSNKFLILLIVITLNFRNYRFYKEIIKFNQKEE